MIKHKNPFRLFKHLSKQFIRVGLGAFFRNFDYIIRHYFYTKVIIKIFVIFQSIIWHHSFFMQPNYHKQYLLVHTFESQTQKACTGSYFPYQKSYTYSRIQNQICWTQLWTVYHYKYGLATYNKIYGCQFDCADFSCPRPSLYPQITILPCDCIFHWACQAE